MAIIIVGLDAPQGYSPRATHEMMGQDFFSPHMRPSPVPKKYFNIKFLSGGKIHLELFVLARAWVSHFMGLSAEDEWQQLDINTHTSSRLSIGHLNPCCC